MQTDSPESLAGSDLRRAERQKERQAEQDKRKDEDAAGA